MTGGKGAGGGGNAAHVSAAIRVLAVKRGRCRAKGQRGKKQVTSSAPKDGRAAAADLVTD